MSNRNERLHRIWRNMKSRCYNRNFHKYPLYGARGIRVCEVWKDNYLCFKAWALSNGYSDNLTLDRVDNNGNYCPENCRWTNHHIQSTNQNKRSDNKTGYVGVSYNRGKYYSGIRVFKKQIWLGCNFTSAEEACLARDKFIIDNNLTEYKTQIIKKGKTCRK